MNNVFDEFMVISFGLEDNELCIIIRNDGFVRREWKKIIWVILDKILVFCLCGF